VKYIHRKPLGGVGGVPLLVKKTASNSAATSGRKST